ncbi:tRNA pseudouridine(55) synthase TruB [Liberiplasma polymorphum]|uniref:tRNA pseudouridine(55) synthase TruB n=1 Tax=Liberiplasma polymorphum TaxID=3374570 RepID=UPI003773F317
MDGIIVINKPLGLSSHDCVSKLRKIYKTRKIGHSGTLDVEATGVLVLGVNKGTKLLNYLNQDEKTYEFDVYFGVETDTLDHTGKVIGENPIFDLSKIDSVIQSFIGEYLQTPPAYSAVKVQGRKLYEYARNEETIPYVDPRKIKVYHFERLSDVSNTDTLPIISFKVHASKGLYVRQLALDLAQKLDTVAHTTRIHRTQAGDYTLDDAIKLDEVIVETPLISMTNALRSLASITLDETDYFAVKNGQTLPLNCNEDLVKLVDKQNNLLAIYEREQETYKAKNVFM